MGWERRGPARSRPAWPAVLLFAAWPAALLAGGLEPVWTGEAPCQRVEAWGPAELTALINTAVGRAAVTSGGIAAYGLAAADLLSGLVDGGVLADLGLASVLDQRRALTAITALKPCIPPAVAAPATTGFCIDSVPAVFVGTGFAGLSALSYQQCVDAGHAWCPLLNDDVGSHLGTQYYRHSPCCSGRQGRDLIPDPAGLPSCISGASHSSCTRLQWQTKLLADLLLDYDPQVAPVTNRVGGGGGGGGGGCFCNANETACLEQSETTCLVCATDERCAAELAVEVSLSLFKLVSVELQVEPPPKHFI